MKSYRDQFLSLAGLLIRIGPIALGTVSGYCLFLVIVPFFMLGVHNVPHHALLTSEVFYGEQVGALAWLGALYIVLGGRLIFTILWLLSLANLAVTQNRFVLILLLIAPLPIIYLNSGPYSESILQWLESA